MAEYTEYSKRWNIRNILKDGIYRILCILLKLTKKQRQRMLGCFEILKSQFFVPPFTIDLMTVLKAILTGEGSCKGI